MLKIFTWLKNLFKKDIMLSVALLAALISLFITPPSKELLSDINWRTLATLFMLLTVLEGFKSEDIFEPVLRKARRLSSIKFSGFRRFFQLNVRYERCVPHNFCSAYYYFVQTEPERMFYSSCPDL